MVVNKFIRMDVLVLHINISFFSRALEKTSQWSHPTEYHSKTNTLNIKVSYVGLSKENMHLIDISSHIIFINLTYFTYKFVGLTKNNSLI